MSRYFLTEVSIEGFRGINNSNDPLVLSFKPDCVNSVYAHNGVGKTSIFEALQFAIRGEISRLKSLQDAEQGDSYIVNRFHPDQEATIELTLTPDTGEEAITIVVTRSAAHARAVSSPSGHPDPEALLKSLDEDFVLVDYHTFARFIDDTALNRGRSFAALIGLSRYSSLRQALEGANHTQTLRNDLGIPVVEARINAEQTRAAEAKARLVEAYRDLTGQTLDKLDDRTTLEGTVTKILSNIGALKEVMESKTVTDFDHAAAVAAIESDSDNANRLKLTKLREDRQAIDGLTFAPDHVAQLDGLENAAKDRDDAVTKVGHADLLSLLKTAAKVVATPAWPNDDLCPVCDTAQQEPLKARLEEKIANYDAVKELDATLCALCLECPALDLLGKLEAAVTLAVPVDERIAAGILAAAKNGAVNSTDLTKAKDRLKALIGQRDNRVAELQADIETLEKSLPPSVAAASRAIENGRKFRDDLTAYDTAREALNQLTRTLDKLNRWRTFIGKASKAFADAETALSTERLTDIEASYKSLFPLLMRGAPNLEPHLARAVKSENIDLTLSNFHGEAGVNARAVLSESYRNAVAASIFLSAAAKSTRPPRFMVLDDITSSFDGGHQYALMDALLKELRFGVKPDGIQFIILSHDGALEKFFDKLGGTKDWHNQKLQGMPPKGSIISSAQGANRLKQKAMDLLNQGSDDLAGPLIRQYLEYKLGYIISKLAIPVPPDYITKPDGRTLSTYLDAITEAVKLYEKAGECVLTSVQTTAVGQTHGTSTISNWIAHYETTIGAPFTAYALIGLLAEIDMYAENFQQVDPNNPGQKIYYRRLNKA
jgi:hypothetical protein